MKEFLILEGAYIFMAAVILLVTLFVTSRPFMKKGAVKKGLSLVFIFLALAISAHYLITKNRMNSVKEAFKNGKKVVCENRIYTKGANFVTINKEEDWTLKNDYFVSPNYTRDFFLARCIVE